MARHRVVVVVDRQAQHLFQSLVYQVATGVLSEGNVAPPLRDVLRHQRNAEVVLADVQGVELERRTVTCGLVGRTWQIFAPQALAASGLMARGTDEGQPGTPQPPGA